MVSQTAFKQAASRFVSGVTVVTAACEGEAHGITVTAFSSLSLDPAQVLVCIDRRSRLHDMIVRSEAFAVNVLSTEQQDLSSDFARTGRPPLDLSAGESPFRVDVTGAPVLRDALAYFDCHLAACYDGGDHSIFVGTVQGVGFAEAGAPLVYWCGSYRVLETPAASA